MSKTRLVTIASLIVIAVMLFLNFWRRREVPEMETAVVSRGTITASIFAPGEIKSAMQADVFAKTSGTVWSLSVEDGQQVQKGQRLLQLDATSAKATVASKELALQTALQKKKDLEDRVYTHADLVAAEALVNERRTAWVRAEEDYNEDKDNEDRKAARDAAYTAYLQAEEILENLKNSNPTNEDRTVVDAEIESAQKALVDAQLGLSRTTITAPQSGTLVFIDAGNGKISQTSVVNSGQKLFTIANLSSFIFEAEVDESEISEVAIGQETKIFLDAYSGVKYTGRVLKIERMTAIDSSGNKVVKVKIELEGIGEDKEGLYLGLSGDAEIIFKEKVGVLLVPVEAVFLEDGKNYIFVVGDEKSTERQVELGMENEDYIEVVKGLSEGEKLDVNPNRKSD